MPFDVRDFPNVPPGEKAAAWQNRRLVAIWLFSVAGMILIMVVLGGVTRLTGSGLSIMEWAPVSGVAPPLSKAAWEQLFALYKQIPQYTLVNEGMSLAGFKQIFWMEWFHRLWGRLIGMAFLIPLVWLWATGRIGRRLVPRLILLFILGGLQGAVGWFMVASGFEPDMTSVSPARLAIHLVLALALYAAIVWIGLDMLQPVPRPLFGARIWRWVAGACFAFVAVTIAAGSFVAGTHAGFDYNTFPLMAGHWIPSDYDRLSPFIRNLTQNIAAVQFDHRLLATVTAATGIALTVGGLLATSLRPVRPQILALAGALGTQYCLGVATLLLVVPIPLAVAHQAVAVLVLTAALILLHALRGAR
jgi:cytochrome c oxidase assembly protein subunit 15